MAYQLTNGRFQAFTDSGAFAVGYKLYTYDSGTTTPKATYTDATLAAVNTNPVVLDARGEAQVWLGLGAYTFVLTDTSGVTVWTVDGVIDPESEVLSNGAILQAQIAQVLTDLADATTTGKGDALIGVKQPFTGSIERTQHQKNAEFISPEDFGAVGDSNGSAGNGTDDTLAFQRAIAAAANDFSISRSAGGEVRCTAGKLYRIAGTIILPSFVTLNLNGAVLVGNSNGSGGNTIVTTGIYTGGALVSNAGNYAGNARITGTRLIGGTIAQSGLGALLTQFGEGCEMRQVQFPNCYHAFDADFSFYDGIEHIMCRGSSPSWAYRLRNNPNVQTLKHVFSVGNAQSFVIDQKAYALTLLSCGAEQGTDGIVLANEAHGLQILGCYFELLNGKAIDLNDVYRKTGVLIDGCFFDSCATLVRGRSVNGFVWGDANERNATCIPGTIDLQTDVTVPTPTLSASTGVFRSRAFDLLVSGNGLPTRPSYLSINTPFDLDACKSLVSTTPSVSDPVFAKARLNSGVVPFDYSGTGGSGNGVVIFTNVSFSGGTTFDVLIDTEILTNGYNFLVFRFDIADNDGTYKVFGRCYGSDVVLEATSAAGKTLTVQDNGSKVRLRLSSFTHPSGSAAVTGVVRHQ